MDRHGNHGVVVCNLLDPYALHQLAEHLNDLRETHCKLSLLNVIENFPSQYYQIPSISQIWENWHDEAEATLTDIARQLAIPQEDCWLAQGNLNRQIEKFMRSQQVDFLIEEGCKATHLHHWFAKICHPHGNNPSMAA